MLKVMIIDNHLTFGQTLADTLMAKCASSAMCRRGTDPDLMDQVRLFSPEMVFIDVQSLEKNCCSLTKNLMAFDPDLHIIWLTIYDQPEYIQKAQDCGARHCLLKSSLTTNGIIDLVRTIRHADRSKYS